MGGSPSHLAFYNFCKLFEYVVYASPQPGNLVWVHTIAVVVDRYLVNIVEMLLLHGDESSDRR